MSAASAALAAWVELGGPLLQAYKAELSTAAGLLPAMTAIRQRFVVTGAPEFTGTQGRMSKVGLGGSTAEECAAVLARQVP